MSCYKEGKKEREALYSWHLGVVGRDTRAFGVRPMAAATNLTYTHIYSSFGPSIVPPWFQSEHRIEVKLSTQYHLMEQTVMLIAEGITAFSH